MKKKLKKSLIILLSVIMIFSLPISASAATRKDVTKTYRKSVTKMLEGFDSYFAYCCGRRQYFKFDDYARTTMVTMKNYKFVGEKYFLRKEKIQPQLKLYFNTSTVKFTKFTNMVSLEILLTCFVIRMVRLFILAVTGAKILQMVS